MILGIDPSLNATGWGVVKKIDRANSFSLIDKGVIQSKAGGDHLRKIATIAKEIDVILTKYPIKVIAIEETIVNKNAASSLKLGLVRGACIGVAAMKSIDVFEYKPNTVKASIVGKGHADKAQVAFMIAKILNINNDFITHDVTDALAIAVTHALISRFS